MGGIRNDDGVCICEILKPAREVRRLAGNGGFLCRTLAEKVANNHGTGRNSDADGEFDLLVVEMSDRSHEVDGGVEGSFRVVLMGARIAKVGIDTVAPKLGNVALIAR